MKAIGVLTTVLLLAGCSTTVLDCQHKAWRQDGFQDGLGGHYPRLDYLQSTCPVYFSGAEYLAGWRDGNRQFCQSVLHDHSKSCRDYMTPRDKNLPPELTPPPWWQSRTHR